MQTCFAFLEKVNKFIGAYEMLNPGDSVTVGFSGGADSVCLMDVLLHLKERLGISIYAVHVNHMLRGDAADMDQEFVQSFCKERGVELRVFTEDIKAYSKKLGMSIEEGGRHFRYKCFEEVRKSVKNGKIAVAHHSDDLCETVIMNALRGSDINGLAGIRPVSGFIVRPLLTVSKAEILEYLEEQGIKFCTDLTNEDTAYMRNRIRHEVIPYIDNNINAGASRHLNELSVSAAEITDFLKQEARKAMEVVCTENTIKIDGFKELHISLKKEIIREMIEKVGGRLKDISQSHIFAVLELFDKQAGKCVNLPYGINAVRESASVRLEIGNDRKILEPIEVTVPGDIYVPGLGKISFDILNDVPQTVADLTYTKVVDYDKIKSRLMIRAMQDLDYIVIDDKGHKKGINRLLMDYKIPADKRKETWLIADGNHIVWIPGMRISEYYKIGDTTKRALVIRREE